MDPLDCMIEDCWLHLFQFLSAKDKQALCDTCETFYEMLQPQKTKWGFQLILPHISRYLTNNPTTDFKQHLNFSLQLRQVCKSWRDGFDKFCTNWEESGNLFAYIQEKYDFSSDARLEKFLNFFKHFPGNPFISMLITIAATSSRHENEIEKDGVNAERRKIMQNRRKLLLELFTNYGKEIDHLYLKSRFYYSDIEYCSEKDAWEFLQLILCKTPNLQSLCLNLTPQGFPARATESPEALETALAQYLELNPLPKLPKLRELGLLKDNPKMITLMLETYGPSLETLLILNSSAISGSPWSSMKCLRDLILESEFTCVEKTLRAIQSPLKTLSFRETFQGRKPSQFMIDKFLLAVQHLPLKEVIVEPASEIVKESVPFPLNFPKHTTIETFNLRNSHPISLSLGFLFFLPNLKNCGLNQHLVERPIKLQCPKYLRQLK